MSILGMHLDSCSGLPLKKKNPLGGKVNAFQWEVWGSHCIRLPPRSLALLPDAYPLGPGYGTSNARALARSCHPGPVPSLWLLWLAEVQASRGQWGSQAFAPRPLPLFQAVSVRTRSTWMGFSASCAIGRPSTSHCWLHLER